MSSDFLDPDSDPFRPPEIATTVGCLHCGQEYDSYLIEWRVFTDGDGAPHGFWCCPTPNCDGRGFGFDIFSTDPYFQDERGGGWVWDDEETDEDSEFESNGSVDSDRSPESEEGLDDIPF